MTARLLVCAAICVGVTGPFAGCRSKTDTDPPVAAPAFSVNHPRAALGSPLELTYRFVVSRDAPRLTEHYRVFVHFLDADEEMLWTDDHDPVVPTTEWKAGQTIEYTRTMFIPIVPYIGEATVQMGLYLPASNKRLPLSGPGGAQRAYNVGTLQILPQSDSLYLIFKDGWHPAEIAENNAAVEWQWTKREATLAFRNPHRNALLYLHVDSPRGAGQETPRVDVRLDGHSVDSFAVPPGQEVLHKTLLEADQLGTSDSVDLKLVVDKTFVPALLPASNSRDARELGVRVFHAFIEPK